MDVLLINEIHLRNMKVFEINGYDFYDSKHPAGTSRGGAGVLIKSRIPHKPFKKHSTHQIQACSVSVDFGGTLILTAYYSPPSRPYPTKEDYTNFFKDQGDRFIVAGDFNAKHEFWGSKSTNKRGKVLWDVIANWEYNVSSCGKPTHWRKFRGNRPDLLDFVVTRNINIHQLSSHRSWQLPSDHAAVLLEYRLC